MPGKKAPPKAEKSYHHGDLHRALLDAAAQILAAEGPGAVTLREVARRAGVTHAAPYRHFADKSALLAAVATEGFRTLRRELVTAWEDGGRGDAAFRAMGVAYVRFALGNSAHYRVMFGGSVTPTAHDSELVGEAEGAFQALVDALAVLQHEAVMRRDDDTVLMARHVWALVHGIAMLAIDGKLHEPGAVEELTQYALDRLRTGIAVRSG